MSLIPGLKSSSSPLDNGNGSAGKGGSPNRDGGRAERNKQRWLLMTLRHTCAGCVLRVKLNHVRAARNRFPHTESPSSSTCPYLFPPAT